MINLSNLSNNAIIICPNQKKDILVKLQTKSNPLKHFKFLSKKELLKGLYFTYDLDAVVFLNQKYGYSLEIAEEILSNLIGIKEYNHKLNELKHLYDDLVDNKLLKVNHYFKHLFANKPVYIYGYSACDLELKTAIEMLKIDCEYLYDEEKDIYDHEVIVFETMEEEVIYVISKICELVKEAVSLNNIYLYQVPSEYHLILKKCLNYHQLPFENSDAIKLYDSPLYQKYLQYLKNYSFEEAYRILKEETAYDPFDVLGRIVGAVISVNELKLPFNEKIKALNYLAKKTTLKKLYYEESLKECNSLSIITDEDYVFMLGFSHGIYPHIAKDIDFYTDEEKKFLNKNPSTVTNQIHEDELISFIKHTKNLTITYKKKIGKNVYYPSLLINKLKMKEEMGRISNIRYSKTLAEYEVAGYIDMDRLYGIKHPYLYTYSKEYLKYGSFNHLFKGLNNYYNDDELTLSYTQIAEYNQCPFKYFVKRLLKADLFEEKFDLNLGNLYHLILEDSIVKDINLDDYEEYIFKHFKTAKERFFVKILLPQVLSVIEKNHEFGQITRFDKVLAEVELNYQVDNRTQLIGRIDRTLFDEVDQNLIVVDYKTGKFKFNKEKINYGIDLQLPIYALLLHDKYPNFTNVGMYIQNVCLDQKELQEKTLYSLDGITLNNKAKVVRLDPQMGSLVDENGKRISRSRFIQGISLTKSDKLGESKKLLTDIEFAELVATAKEQITSTIDKIRHGVFDISPIKFSCDQDAHCKYCNFKDLCFSTYQDIRYIELKKQQVESEEE